VRPKTLVHLRPTNGNKHTVVLLDGSVCREVVVPIEVSPEIGVEQNSGHVQRSNNFWRPYLAALPMLFRPAWT
jgi:hypothetical protein